MTTSPLVLWDFQRDAVEAIYAYFGDHTGNPIVAMPTGTGKSLVIGDFLRSAVTTYPGTRAMVLTHVKELISQNLDKMLRLWPTAPAGVFSAGLKKRDTHAPITFAGIASVYDKAHLFGHQDLVLIDECHLISPKANTMYGQFLTDLKHTNPDLKAIGFSATPYRLGLGRLTEGTIFTDFCFDITGREAFNWLVENKYLSRLVTKRTDFTMDVSGVGTHGDEYIPKELQAAVDKEDITRRALHEAVARGADRKHWLVFATGIEHAEHVADHLKELGVAAAVVHSKMTTEQRDNIINDFKEGYYQALVNNNVLTTGFDFQAIDLIICLRPTQSPSLWVQMLGRGTRVYPEKNDCLVLDFAGNCRRLGPINDPVLPRKKGAKGMGSAPVKVCEVCGTYNHASVTVCEECGAEFPRILKIKERAATEEVMILRNQKLEVPVVEVVAVDRVVYAEHTKRGMPPSIQVTYYCGLNSFREWVCLEHPGFPGKKARDWWRKRTEVPPPQTIREASPYLTTLAVATHLRVWLNRKYPTIMDYDFTGSAFGQKASS